MVADGRGGGGEGGMGGGKKQPALISRRGCGHCGERWGRGSDDASAAVPGASMTRFGRTVAQSSTSDYFANSHDEAWFYNNEAYVS